MFAYMEGNYIVEAFAPEVADLGGHPVVFLSFEYNGKKSRESIMFDTESQVKTISGHDLTVKNGNLVIKNKKGEGELKNFLKDYVKEKLHALS